jgi:hypothetical protein
LPFGLGSEKEDNDISVTEGHFEEINKIREMLNPDEKVLLVADNQ